MADSNVVNHQVRTGREKGSGEGEPNWGGPAAGVCSAGAWLSHAHHPAQSHAPGKSWLIR